MKLCVVKNVKARIAEDVEQAEIDVGEEDDEELYCDLYCTQRSKLILTCVRNF